MSKKFLAQIVAITALLGGQAIASSAIAQGAAATEEIAARIEATSARLNLTEEQKPEVEKILQNAAEERANIFESFGIEEGTRPDLNLLEIRDLRSQLQKLNEDTTTQLADVLTDDQMAEFKEIQEERREEFRAAMQGS